MCFHSKQSKKAQELIVRYKRKIYDEENFEPQIYLNGFAHPETPVISKEDEKIIQHYGWGLIPFWAKENSIS